MNQEDTGNSPHRRNVAVWACDEVDFNLATRQVVRSGHRTVQLQQVPVQATTLPLVVPQLIYAALPRSDEKSLIEVIKELITKVPAKTPILVNVWERDLANVGALITTFTHDFLVHGASLPETGFRIEKLALQQDESIAFGHYEFCRLGYSVTLDGRSVSLQRAEFEVALYLFNHPGVAVAREKLHSLYGSRNLIEGRSIDALISRIRRKLELTLDNGVVISSVRNMGYKLFFI